MSSLRRGCEDLACGGRPLSIRPVLRWPPGCCGRARLPSFEDVA